MDEQACMRFVRGAAEPPPLAAPLVEEEALLQTETEARIQRLRQTLDAQQRTWTYTLAADSPYTVLRREDVAALLDARAALVEAARWLIDELQAPDDEYRLNEADKAMDAVIALLATAAPQPAGQTGAPDAA